MNIQKLDFQSLTGIRQDFLGKAKIWVEFPRESNKCDSENYMRKGVMRQKILRNGLEKSERKILDRIP